MFSILNKQMTCDVFTNHYRSGEYNSENSIHFYYCRIELTSHKNKAKTTATPWSATGLNIAAGGTPKGWLWPKHSEGGV